MRDLSWGKTDVVCDNTIHYSVRFRLIGGKAQVVRGADVLAEREATDWSHLTGSTYKVSFGDGSSWEVLKLRCNCPEDRK